MPKSVFSKDIMEWWVPTKKILTYYRISKDTTIGSMDKWVKAL